MALTERDINVPRKTPPTQKTPTTQSRLPRRIPIRTSTPPNTASWSSAVAARVASAEKTTSATPKLSIHKDVSVVSTRKVQPTNAAAADKPLPGEKPLPPRPIARISSSQSPSKDTRSLIDAREEPLHITSVAGEKHDWPSLTPQSTDSKSTTHATDFAEKGHVEDSLAKSPSQTTAASLMAAATVLTNVITGKCSIQEHCDLAASQSSTSSYASANDGNTAAQSKVDPDLEMEKTRDDDISSTPENGKTETQSATSPTREASLRSRTSDGNLGDVSGGSPNEVIGSTEFTRAQTMSPTLTESRHHSPSPASFSRPRPGSFSQTSSRSVKTASRIPVPGAKTFTVIGVKKDHASQPSMLNAAPSPSFGSRRLASPEALKILENGKMRRQLKHMPSDATASGARAERTWTPDSSATAFTAETPSLSYSVDSSPNGTPAPNSPELRSIVPNNSPNDTVAPNSPEMGPMTPTSPNADETNMAHCNPTPQQEYRHTAPGGTNGSNSRGNVSLDEGKCHIPICSRQPPSTSPFTMPLQRIPSQAILPTENIHKHDEKFTELTRTLSLLEGQGSAPNTEVDQQTLIRMFGHLKCGPEKNLHKSATLSQNAAAAEKYLAQHLSSAKEVNADEKTSESVAEEHNANPDPNRTRNKTQSPCKDERKETMISKWSDSTPSNKGLSPVADGLSAAQAISPTKSSRSAAATRDGSIDDVSIGYPSIVPAKEIPVLSQPRDETASDAPIVPRRRSSPTLGKSLKPNNQPGSVRAARAGIQVANAAFTQTTISAESKKPTRMPTPNTKKAALSASESRGRSTPTQKRQSRQTNGTAPKTPRSRSRSRYVLDKINGLFSGKRDKKNPAIPPVPKFKNGTLNKSAAVKSKVAISTDGSPTKPLQLPKTRSRSSSTQTATTTKTEDAPTIDKFLDSQSVKNLSEHVISKAQSEKNTERKERLLNFAKVLNDSLINAREAQISAETAQHAANSAQMSYEMTQQSLAMLQRLAARMTRAANYGRS